MGAKVHTAETSKKMSGKLGGYLILFGLVAVSWAIFKVITPTNFGSSENMLQYFQASLIAATGAVGFYFVMVMGMFDFSIGANIMVSLVSAYSLNTIAAYGITSKIEIFLFYPAMAMNMALTSIIGQCFGAKDKERTKQYLKSGITYGGMLSCVSTILVCVFAGTLSMLFVRSAEDARIVEGFFKIISVGYVCYMVTSCFLGKCSGEGKPEWAMLLMIIYYIIIRIPLAVMLSHTTLGLNGIWTAILVSHDSQRYAGRTGCDYSALCICKCDLSVCDWTDCGPSGMRGSTFCRE